MTGRLAFMGKAVCGRFRVDLSGLHPTDKGLSAGAPGFGALAAAVFGSGASGVHSSWGAGGSGSEWGRWKEFAKPR